MCHCHRNTSSIIGRGAGWSGARAATRSADGCHAEGKWTWRPRRLLSQSNLKPRHQYDIVYWNFQSTVSEKFLCIWHHDGSVMRMDAALLHWHTWARLFGNSQFYHVGSTWQPYQCSCSYHVMFIWYPISNNHLLSVLADIHRASASK